MIKTHTFETKFLTWIVTLTTLLLINICPYKAFGQEFSLEDLLETPYISNLTASPISSTVFFTINEQGKRNVYRAAAPDYALEKLTDFGEDDGQEITSLSVSSDGQWLVFVRGGDHGANSSAQPVNPASHIVPQTIELYSISLETGDVQSLGEGDFPLIHPHRPFVTFLRRYQVWTVPLNGSEKSKPLFSTRGSVRSLQWSPDGQQLAFSVRRGDHAFIGVFNQGSERLQWIQPSFHVDGMPRWSPDGRSIAFIRQPGIGGALDSLLAKTHQPWSIQVADVEAGTAKTVWEAPHTLPGSYPRWSGGANLDWHGSSGLVFLSYQDGWPHLYRVDVQDRSVRQLTKGNYSVDHISMSADHKKIVFCANAGTDDEAIDRMHVGLIDLEANSVKMLTRGKSIESFPTFMNRDREIAMLRSTAKRPLLPAVYSLQAGGEPQLIGKALMASFDYTRLTEPKQVTFTSEDGLQLRGQLFKPKNGSKNMPAVVYIHGGPRRQMYLGWHFIDYYFYDYAVNQYLASQGIAVLAINYRMGTGYGYAFQNPDKAGTNGASEYQDIVAAGKWLAQQSFIDPKAIGVFGGSYGGYLTAMALGKNSDLFKAGVDIHGVHNRQKKRNAEQYPPDFEEAAKIAWESSPSHWVDGWESPVLIIHGDDDQNVDFGQSLDLVARLRKKGVTADYLVIPDDTHHWMLFSNLLKVKKATVSFLKQHFLNETNK